jgi:exonuclease SbcC
MIHDLYIENFQSHKTSSLSFGPGVNVITGTSDSGKSAIIRSLIWVINNRPTGDSVRNWNAKKDESTVVSIGLGETFVEKERKDNQTVYRKGTDEAAEVYQAVRTDVPEPVAEALNLADYNVQTQHQPYFLLQDTPGQRAERLNKLVDLEVIDRVFKKLNARVQSNRSQSNFCYNERTKAENELEALRYIDAAEIEVRKIDSSIAEYNLKSAKIAAMRSAIQTLAVLNENITSFSFYLDLEQAVIPILEMLAEYAEKKKRVGNLSIEITTVENIAEDIAAYKDWLLVEDYVAPIADRIAKWTEKQARINSLHRTMISLQASAGNLSKAKQEVLSKTAEYKKLLQQAGVCPTCKSPINSDILKHIEEAL